MGQRSRRWSRRTKGETQTMGTHFSTDKQMSTMMGPFCFKESSQGGVSWTIESPEAEVTRTGKPSMRGLTYQWDLAPLTLPRALPLSVLPSLPLTLPSQDEECRSCEWKWQHPWVGSIPGAISPTKSISEAEDNTHSTTNQRILWKDRTKSTRSLREISQADQRRGDSTPGKFPTPGASWADGFPEVWEVDVPWRELRQREPEQEDPVDKSPCLSPEGRFWEATCPSSLLETVNQLPSWWSWDRWVTQPLVFPSSPAPSLYPSHWLLWDFHTHIHTPPPPNKVLAHYICSSILKSCIKKTDPEV